MSAEVIEGNVLATEKDYLLWRLNAQWSNIALTPPDYVGVRDYGFPRPPKEARFL